MAQEFDIFGFLRKFHFSVVFCVLLSLFAVSYLSHSAYGNHMPLNLRNGRARQNSVRGNPQVGARRNLQPGSVSSRRRVGTINNQLTNRRTIQRSRQASNAVTSRGSNREFRRRRLNARRISSRVSSRGRLRPGSNPNGRVRPMRNAEADRTLNERGNLDFLPSSINRFINSLRERIPNIGLGLGVNLQEPNGNSRSSFDSRREGPRSLPSLSEQINGIGNLFGSRRSSQRFRQASDASRRSRAQTSETFLSRGQNTQFRSRDVQLSPTRPSSFIAPSVPAFVDSPLGQDNQSPSQNFGLVDNNLNPGQQQTIPQRFVSQQQQSNFNLQQQSAPDFQQQTVSDGQRQRMLINSQIQQNQNILVQPQTQPAFARAPNIIQQPSNPMVPTAQQPFISARQQVVLQPNPPMMQTMTGQGQQGANNAIQMNSNQQIIGPSLPTPAPIITQAIQTEGQTIINGPGGVFQSASLPIDQNSAGNTGRIVQTGFTQQLQPQAQTFVNTQGQIFQLINGQLVQVQLPQQQMFTTEQILQAINQLQSNVAQNQAQPGQMHLAAFEGAANKIEKLSPAGSSATNTTKEVRQLIKTNAQIEHQNQLLQKLLLEQVLSGQPDAGAQNAISSSAKSSPSFSTAMKKDLKPVLAFNWIDVKNGKKSSDSLRAAFSTAKSFKMKGQKTKSPKYTLIAKPGSEIVFTMNKKKTVNPKRKVVSFSSLRKSVSKNNMVSFNSLKKVVSKKKPLSVRTSSNAGNPKIISLPIKKSKVAASTNAKVHIPFDPTAETLPQYRNSKNDTLRKLDRTDRLNTTDIPEEIEVNGQSLDSPADRTGAIRHHPLDYLVHGVTYRPRGVTPSTVFDPNAETLPQYRNSTNSTLRKLERTDRLNTTDIPEEIEVNGQSLDSPADRNGKNIYHPMDMLVHGVTASGMNVYHHAQYHSAKKPVTPEEPEEMMYSASNPGYIDTTILDTNVMYRKHFKDPTLLSAVSDLASTLMSSLKSTLSKIPSEFLRGVQYWMPNIPYSTFRSIQQSAPSIYQRTREAVTHIPAYIGRGVLDLVEMIKQSSYKTSKPVKNVATRLSRIMYDAMTPAPPPPTPPMWGFNIFDMLNIATTTPTPATTPPIEKQNAKIMAKLMNMVKLLIKEPPTSTRAPSVTTVAPKKLPVKTITATADSTQKSSATVKSKAKIQSKTSNVQQTTNIKVTVKQSHTSAKKEIKKSGPNTHLRRPPLPPRKKPYNISKIQTSQRRRMPPTHAPSRSKVAHKPPVPKKSNKKQSQNDSKLRSKKRPLPSKVSIYDIFSISDSKQQFIHKKTEKGPSYRDQHIATPPPEMPAFLIKDRNAKPLVMQKAEKGPSYRDQPIATPPPEMPAFLQKDRIAKPPVMQTQDMTTVTMPPFLMRKSYKQERVAAQQVIQPQDMTTVTMPPFLLEKSVRQKLVTTPPVFQPQHMTTVIMPPFLARESLVDPYMYQQTTAQPVYQPDMSYRNEMYPNQYQQPFTTPPTQPPTPPPTVARMAYDTQPPMYDIPQQQPVQPQNFDYSYQSNVQQTAADYTYDASSFGGSQSGYMGIAPPVSGNFNSQSASQTDNNVAHSEFRKASQKGFQISSILGRK